MKVRLICYLYNKKLADLDIKTEDEEEASKIKCVIYLKNGESFWIKRNYDDMILLGESNDFEDYTERKQSLKQ